MLKKPVVILSGVAAIAVVVAVVSTVLALRSPKEAPTVSVWTSSGSYARVAPRSYCDFDVTKCDVDPGTGEIARLAIPANARVLLSVPAEVAKGWILKTDRVGKDGHLKQEQKLFFPQAGGGDPTYATWLEPDPDGLALRSISVEIVSAVRVAGEDNLFTRAQWLICAGAEDCEHPAG